MHDVCVAHKDYVVRGGGEVLAERLAEIFDATLVVGRRDAANEPPGLDAPIEELPLARWQRVAVDRGGLPRAAAYMAAWQTAPIEEYDTVITSGNEPLWYVPEDRQTVVAYTHSTPRFMYDLFQTENPGTVGKAYQTMMRTVYQHNVTRPDLWVANSDLVARRIERYWGVDRADIRVVYPPVPTHEFRPEAAATGDYLLSLGRLAPAKQTHGVVRAANRMEVPLRVAGDGPERERLERIAGETVDVLGRVSEVEKRGLLAGASALVFNARNEDFGMVPVEAMAAGTAVIGVRDGFTQFQVQDGKNGLTFERGLLNLCAAIDRFRETGVAWDADRIAAFAERFGVAQFERGMREAVETARRESRVRVPWDDGGEERPETMQDILADGGDP